MSSLSQNLTKVVSFDEFADVEVKKSLYGIWFGLHSHKQFDALPHPILFVTDISEEAIFGFAITKINRVTRQVTLRAHYLQHHNLQDFLTEQHVTLISGSITPTLINLNN